jgi:uncharacterized membrane protein
MLGAALIAGARRGRSGSIMRLAGFGLMGFAVRPLLVDRVRRAGETRRVVTAQRSIEIDRPVADVFRFFKDFESFPRVAGGLRSVTDYEDGRSHWEVYAPSGEVLPVDVVVTKYVPNCVIGWESVAGSPVEMRGVIRFSPLGPQRTRLDASLQYRPTETRLADAIRALLSRRSAPLSGVLDRIRFYLESLPAGT